VLKLTYRVLKLTYRVPLNVIENTRTAHVSWPKFDEGQLQIRLLVDCT
jgi:hypothetical protein